jgi:Flp pilus assembly protein TadG
MRLHFEKGERGAAAVEFAIILPLLIMMLFGIVQFAIVYNHQQGLHAAAREGARIAALPTTTKTDIQDRVKDALSGVLSSSDIAAATITISPAGNQPCDLQPSGTPVVVTVSTKYQLDVPLVMSKSMTLTGRGEFRCE